MDLKLYRVVTLSGNVLFKSDDRQEIISFLRECCVFKNGYFFRRKSLVFVLVEGSTFIMDSTNY